MLSDTHESETHSVEILKIYFHHFFLKKFVKSTPLVLSSFESTASRFHEIFFSSESKFLVFSTLCNVRKYVMREVVQSRTDDVDAVIAATKEPSPTEEAAMGTQAGDLQPLVSDLTPGELVNQLSMV